MSDLWYNFNNYYFRALCSVLLWRMIMFGMNKAQKHGLHIMIIGCGKVGRTLVEQLCLEGHDITVIDKNAAKV